MDRPLPLIGLCCSYQQVVDEGETREMAFVYKEYFDAIAARGGLPFLLPPLLKRAQIVKALERVDGLVLIGGHDLDPELYGQPVHAKTKLGARRRNEFDLAAVGIALESFAMPIFCICQGAQVLNVVCGGDLIQHIPEMVPGAVAHEEGKLGPEGHAVTVEEGTRLHSLVKRYRICVNSHHHQAIGRVGKGLRVAARCEADGVIEAIEWAGEDGPAAGWNARPDADGGADARDGLTDAAPLSPLFSSVKESDPRARGQGARGKVVEPARGRRRFVVGVQWHPEMEGGDAEVSASLFDAFLEVAGSHVSVRT